MRNILIIAKREFLEQIRGRAFKISTVMVQLLIVEMMVWRSMNEHHAGTGKHIAIASNSAPLANAISREMLADKDAKFIVDVVAPATPSERDSLQNQVQSKAIDGVLAIDESAAGVATATYTSLSSGDFAGNWRMTNALNHAVTSQRLLAQGVKQADADAALESVSIDNLQLEKNGTTGKSKGAAPFFKLIMLLMLLAMPIMLYGLDMARAIIEEKTSRIFEVMLAIARPDELLTGKLLGVGGVAMTQIAIWMIAATLFMGSSLAAAALTGNLAIHFSLMEGLLFPVYFVLGFALFSTMFSGLAATCETAQDLQKFMALAIVPLYLSMGLLPVLLKDPNSTLSIAASICPLTSAYIMLPRLGLGPVPLWQIATSVVLLMLSVWAMLWFSSRLYRVGILMYGKRATVPEMIRWMRYS
ncbi:MAG: ABC transporter permease [Terracidiphilus sp.]